MVHNMLVNDMVIQEDVCNGDCSYCMTGESNLKEKHKMLFYEGQTHFNRDKIFKSESYYQKGNKLEENLNYVTEIIEKRFSPAILKISGGEIFLIKNILDYVKLMAPRYDRIQILTNGLLLNEKIIKELSEIRTVSLQLSMDGHLLDMNCYRIRDQKLQDKLCDILKYCEYYGIQVEINCVLTNVNTYKITEFAEYLSQYNNVLLLPFPVRGSMGKRFAPTREQSDGVKNLIDEYNRLKNILPPYGYIEALYLFLITGEKKYPCYIPHMVIHSFDDGIVTPCPNVWFKQLGNLLSNPSKTLNSIGNDPFYMISNRHRNVLKECRSCFTPWDILNLYLCNKIELDEIKRIYLYNHKNTLDFFKEKIKLWRSENENIHII